MNYHDNIMASGEVPPLVSECTLCHRVCKVQYTWTGKHYMPLCVKCGGNALPPFGLPKDVSLEEAMVMDTRFGFEPDMYINLSGVSMDPLRQEALEQASVFVTGAATLLSEYGGVMLIHDVGNKWDEYALKVLLPTKLTEGKLDGFTEVGFIPRKVCLSCWHVLRGKEADLDACPRCSTSTKHPACQVNKYLLEMRGQGHLQIAVRWINKQHTTWGAQLVVKLPEIGHAIQ